MVCGDLNLRSSFFTEDLWYKLFFIVIILVDVLENLPVSHNTF